MSIEALQAQAGHRSIASTQLYLHLGDNWIADEYRVFETLLPGLDQAAGGRGHRGPDVSGDAPMSAVATTNHVHSVGHAPRSWEEISVAAPQLATTMRAYLAELATRLSPGSVGAAETTLRQFAGWVTAVDPTCTTVAAIGAHHVDAYRPWFLATPTPGRDDRSRPPPSTTGRTCCACSSSASSSGAIWIHQSSCRSREPNNRPRRLTPEPHPRWRRTKLANKVRPRRPERGPVPEISWEEIARSAPQMAATMTAYLGQLAVTSRPATVDSASLALRHLAAHLTRTDPDCVSVAAIERRHVESYKIVLAARPGRSHQTTTLAAQTIRHNLGQRRTFFERVIDWDYSDAPAGSRSSRGICPRPTSRHPSSWTTRLRPSSWPRWPPIPTGAGG